jgi:hypothetical protein
VRSARRLADRAAEGGRTRFLTSGDPAGLRQAVDRLLPQPWAVQANYEILGV